MERERENLGRVCKSSEGKRERERKKKENPHFRSVFLLQYLVGKIYVYNMFIYFPTSRAFFKWLCVSERRAARPVIFLRSVAKERERRRG